MGLERRKSWMLENLHAISSWKAQSERMGSQRPRRISFSNKPTPVITSSLEMATLFSTHEPWDGRGAGRHILAIASTM